MKNREQTADRLRIALDLFEVGVSIMEQRLRRKHPAAADPEIRAMLAEWIRTRPGAEHGDAVGRLISGPAGSGV